MGKSVSCMSHVGRCAWDSGTPVDLPSAALQECPEKGCSFRRQFLVKSEKMGRLP